MNIFPRSPIWSVIQESAKRPNSSDHISANIAQKALIPNVMKPDQEKDRKYRSTP